MIFLLKKNFLRSIKNYYVETGEMIGNLSHACCTQLLALRLRWDMHTPYSGDAVRGEYFKFMCTLVSFIVDEDSVHQVQTR